MKIRPFNRKKTFRNKAFELLSSLWSYTINKTLREAPLLTNNYVFSETLSLLTKRLGKVVAAQFGASLRTSELVRILYLDSEYEEAAWKEFLRFRDKEFDFVDSTCFAVMEKQGIQTAFSFDRHYAQRGYRMVP